MRLLYIFGVILICLLIMETVMSLTQRQKHARRAKRKFNVNMCIDILLFSFLQKEPRENRRGNRIGTEGIWMQAASPAAAPSTWIPSAGVTAASTPTSACSAASRRSALARPRVSPSGDATSTPLKLNS